MQLVPLSTDGRVTVVVTAPLPSGPLRVALRMDARERRDRGTWPDRFAPGRPVHRRGRRRLPAGRERGSPLGGRRAPARPGWSTRARPAPSSCISVHRPRARRGISTTGRPRPSPTRRHSWPRPARSGSRRRFRRPGPPGRTGRAHRGRAPFPDRAWRPAHRPRRGRSTTTRFPSRRWSCVRSSGSGTSTTPHPASPATSGGGFCGPPSVSRPRCCSRPCCSTACRPVRLRRARRPAPRAVRPAFRVPRLDEVR